jgi:AcrR family transcriptional regulator
MARAFTDEEKAHIQRRLLEIGHDLYSRHGIKKTSIDDLTRPLGIARSSFYLFFASKEALYLELLQREGAGIEERVLGASFRSTDNMREGIARFLRAVIHEIESNPLTRRLVTHPEEMELFARAVSPEQIEAKNKASLAIMLPFVQRGQEQGQVIDGDPEVISAAIRAITLLTMHRDDIGEDRYPHVLELLIDLVAKGLTDREP